MIDPFSFIFSRARQLEPGVVCRNVTLGRDIVDKIIAGLDLDAMSSDGDDLVVDCQAEIADHLMLSDDEIDAETCFYACVNVLLLLLALDKLDVAPPTAGIAVFIDRDPADPLDGKVLLRMQSYDREQLDELNAAMREMGSEHRDLGAEARAARQTERDGATIH